MKDETENGTRRSAGRGAGCRHSPRDRNRLRYFPHPQANGWAVLTTCPGRCVGSHAKGRKRGRRDLRAVSALAQKRR